MCIHYLYCKYTCICNYVPRSLMERTYYIIGYVLTAVQSIFIFLLLCMFLNKILLKLRQPSLWAAERVKIRWCKTNNKFLKTYWNTKHQLKTKSTASFAKPTDTEPKPTVMYWTNARWCAKRHQEKSEMQKVVKINHCNSASLSGHPAILCVL